MPFDLTSAAWDIGKILGGGLLGFAGSRLLERARKIYMHFEDWKFDQAFKNIRTNEVSWRTGDPGPEWTAERRFRFSFVLRIFSRKTVATGLHRIQIQFTRRRWFSRQVVMSCSELDAGPLKMVGQWLATRDRLEEISIPPSEWAGTNIVGVQENPSMPEWDEAWFVGEFPNGKRFRRRIFRRDRQKTEVCGI